MIFSTNNTNPSPDLVLNEFLPSWFSAEISDVRYSEQSYQLQSQISCALAEPFDNDKSFADKA